MQLCNDICLSSLKYSEYQYYNRVQNSQIFERMSKEKTLKKELGILAGIRNCEKYNSASKKVVDYETFSTIIKMAS